MAFYLPQTLFEMNLYLILLLVRDGEEVFLTGDHRTLDWQKYYKLYENRQNLLFSRDKMATISVPCEGV